MSVSAIRSSAFHSVTRLHNLAERVDQWRVAGERIALVATRGNLHRGHQAMIRAAAKEAERVVVVAYDNPLQYGPGDPTHRFARAHERDAELAAAAGAHLLFTPPDFEVFPGGIDAGVRVEVPDLGAILCGRARPWYFPAVTTVMMKFIAAVQPAVVLCGEKDYQELVILRRALADLLSRVRVVAVPTVREHDGLAVATRNRLLHAGERNLAARVYETLGSVRRQIQKGARDFRLLEEGASRTLERAGLHPEYLEIRQAADLSAPRADTGHFVILVAARLGACRLIDNVFVHVESTAS